MPDPEVLALAAQQGRLLVTHDVHSMPRHFGEFLAAGGNSPGVLLIRQSVPVAIATDWLVLIWLASEAPDWENRIVEIPFRNAERSIGTMRRGGFGL